MFIDEGLARFLFLWVKRIHFSDLWNESGLEINGVVIWSVGRKNIVGCFGEHVFEVRTPIRDLLIGGPLELGRVRWTR